MAAFEEIRMWAKEIREKPAERRTDCPECSWALIDGQHGLHCPFCGYTEGMQKAGVGLD